MSTKKKSNISPSSRRGFLKKAGLVSAAAIGATAAKAPYVYAASNPIKWRLQTYSGAPLGAHVVLPQISRRETLLPAGHSMNASLHLRFH